MSEAWSQWKGQVVDGRFELKQCLDSSGRSAVFLTQICARSEGSRQLSSGIGGEPQPIPLAIKLIAADPAQAARQLSRWRLAQILSHPNLLRVFDAGRCRMGDTELIFGVMEYADENLAQILPQRPLTIEEIQAMLEPTLGALAYLHEQGLVHGGLKPANVMAMGDQLKLASDRVSPAKEVVPDPETPGLYDAPETADGMRSPASDVWSLGMVLSQALTQRLPTRSGLKDEATDPMLPENLPGPYEEIVRGCLRRDVQLRLTVDDVAARLHGRAPEQASAAVVVSQETIVVREAPVSQKPVASAEVLAPQAPGARQETPGPQKSVEKPAPVKPTAVGSPIASSTGPRASKHEWRPRSVIRRKELPGRAALLSFISWTVPLIRRFALPLVVAIAALSALYAGLGLLHHDSGTRPEDPPSAKSEQQHAVTVTPRTTSLRSSTKPSPGGSPIGGSRVSAVDGQGRNALGGPGGDVSGNGRDLGVVQQLLPRASQSALDTIQGTVRASVRVKVDPAGNVTAAELVSSGSSQYFARLSLEAARGWKFGSSRDPERPFLLHFEFRNRGTTAYATWDSSKRETAGAP
ncbi:MAG TPA: protein kinase [Terriglobales bacterium]